MFNKLPRLWILLILISQPTFLAAQIEFERHTIDNNLVSAAWVQAIDMDGDGDLDLVTGSYDGVDWWQNSANSFTKRRIGSFRGTWAVHADDVDADGDIDVIGASSGEDAFAYWQRTGSTSFSETSLGDALGPESVHAADLDGDGDLDIVGVAWADDQILWWRNDGNGRFERKVLDGNLNNAHSVSTGDLDGDGDFDVLATGVAGTRWYRNDGNAAFKKRTIHDKGGWSVFIDDIDGDGDLDFLRPQRNNGDVVLFWNDGTGSFDSQIIEPGFGDCWAIATGDIDGDGDADIAGAGFAAGEVRVWLNAGDHRFSAGHVVERVDKPRGIYVADIDNDGDADLVAAIRGDRDLAWYEVVGSPKSITVNSPSDQTELFGGSNFIINWDFTGLIDSVRIELSADGGDVWTAIAHVPAQEKQYEWPVPQAASDSSVIRISEIANPSVFGTSAGWFSIVPSSLLLEAPNGGESWTIIDDQLIRWITTGTVDSVCLEFSIDNGKTWVTIVDHQPNQGSHLWSVPDVISDSCLVRVSDSRDGLLNDRSDAVFSIRGSSIELQSPNGGEQWFEGTVQNITWRSEGRIDSVGLEYSADGGKTWVTIIQQTENDGDFAWQLPTIASDSCKVRVHNAGLNAISDTCDGVFSIRASTLVLRSPNGGESWGAGSLHEIEWDFTGRIDSVSLEYSLDGGRDWLTISNDVENSGSYTWTVPAVASDSCLIRVSDADDSQPRAQSDAFFSIGVVVSVSTGESLPNAYRLLQNFPNPFNLGTRIGYELPETSPVSMVIYDLLGREVRRLVHASQRPGFHEVHWNGLDNSGRIVGSGVYILQLRAGASSKSLRVVLAK